MRRLALVVAALLAASGLQAVGHAQTTGSAIPDPDVLLEQLEEALEELLAPEPYEYLSAGKRDPFVALIDPDGARTGADLPGVGDLIIVGVLWADTEYIALAETHDGRSLTLRPEDPIRNGRILSVSESGVVVRHTHYGVTRTVTLPIASGEEERNER